MLRVVIPMSRIGRAPITVPSGVKVKIEGQNFHVEGPKGKLSIVVPESLVVIQDQQLVKVSIKDATDLSLKAMHGLYRALINNMVQGVVAGFSKELEIVGVGYRAQLQGKQLSLSVGFSHPVIVEIPAGLTVEVPKPTQVVIKGVDKPRPLTFTKAL